MDHFNIADLNGDGDRLGRIADRFLAPMAADHVEQTIEGSRQHAWVAKLPRHRDRPLALDLGLRRGARMQQRPGERGHDLGADCGMRSIQLPECSLQQLSRGRFRRPAIPPRSLFVGQRGARA